MYLGLLLTLLVGLFFLIGIIILKNAKNKNELSIFTISMAFIVMLGLVFIHLLPELIETKNYLLVIPSIIGFLILIFLDKLIPHHHHEHSNSKCDKHDHEEHLNHIGIVTIIALTIHNIIEGISLYSVTLNDIKSGLLMMISIALHNIPLGFQIGNVIDYKSNKLLIIFLCLSSFLGSLIMIIFGGLNTTLINILLSLTLGMLLYILIFELLSEVKNNLNKKETYIGLIIGLVILIITYII